MHRLYILPLLHLQPVNIDSVASDWLLCLGFHLLLTKCARLQFPFGWLNRKEETQTHHLSNLIWCYSFAVWKSTALLLAFYYGKRNLRCRHFHHRLIKYPDKCIFTTKLNHTRFKAHCAQDVEKKHESNFWPDSVGVNSIITERMCIIGSIFLLWFSISLDMVNLYGPVHRQGI